MRNLFHAAETRSIERVRAYRKRRKRGLGRHEQGRARSTGSPRYVDAKSRGDRYERAVRDFLVYLSRHTLSCFRLLERQAVSFAVLFSARLSSSAQYHRLHV
jgi:hypothetical protein